MNERLFSNSADCATLFELWDSKKEKPSASARRTSPRRAGHRRLGGTATEARREGRGTESGVGGLLMTLDLGATRYRDFQRNVGGGSRTTNPSSLEKPTFRGKSGEGTNVEHAYDVESEWRSDSDKGITLSVEESIALWNFLQHSDTAEYWLTPEMSSIAQKAKSFYKHGPWEDEDGAA